MMTGLIVLRSLSRVRNSMLCWLSSFRSLSRTFWESCNLLPTLLAFSIMLSESEREGEREREREGEGRERGREREGEREREGGRERERGGRERH